MISLCCPTRGRPDGLLAMIETAADTAAGPVEAVMWVDDDDRSYDQMRANPSRMPLPTSWLSGSRRTMSDTWNPCAESAVGGILGVAADDIRFRTSGWDKIVDDAVADWPDGIVLVHGVDGSSWGTTHGTHPFVTRRWVDTVGRFTPPMFEMDYVDTWLCEVANRIGRRVVVDVLMEHLHPTWGTAPMDRTHAEKFARGDRQQPGVLYGQLAGEREREAAMLTAAIEEQPWLT